MVVWGPLRQVPGAESCLESITRINADLECEAAAYLLNEKAIEKCWSRAGNLEGDGPGYWLLMARLAEAAMLCAGNYADNCEYQAAGDFLVNPREILVRKIADGRSEAKNRHGRLSEQFGLEGVEGLRSMKRFSAGVSLEITQPPLLAHMTHFLRGSKRISPEYLQRLEEGQRRIADTLAFLSAWRIFDSADLWRRLQASSARERGFAESQLCRFGTRVFQRLGTDLKQSLAEPGYRSPFLAACRRREVGPRQLASATAHALAGSPA